MNKSIVKGIKMKILWVVMISLVSLYSKDINPVWIKTSQPDYNKVVVVDTSASTTTVLKTRKIDGKSQYVTFTEAFSDYHKRNIATIRQYLDKNNYDGVCNLKITFNVTKDGYYFLSTYDAYVFKK